MLSAAMCVLFWFGFVAYHTSQLFENALFFTQAGLRGISRKKQKSDQSGLLKAVFYL